MKQCLNIFKGLIAEDWVGSDIAMCVTDNDNDETQMKRRCGSNDIHDHLDVVNDDDDDDDGLWQ